ncbi:MAG: YIP1 family protein [Elusimicrobia bacterium]|nr:YIP1 family protein [Elusimicrobiota bacterium]
MELVFDFFEDHLKAAAAVKSRRPLALGLFCFILGALSFFLAMSVSGRLQPLPFNSFTLGLFLLWELGSALVLVAALHLIADFQGRPGSGGELFVLFGFANLSWGLAVPVALLFLALFPSAHWPLTAAFLLVGLYSLGLKARSLQDTYQMSQGRAWVTLALPYLGTLLASALAFILAMASVVLQIMKGFS